ncbi:MAG: glutamate-5-semialdehyde dehydrogenase, partial [Aquiluna sp.]|nr:glutamate-5-semialdehyde dehydrogenase [Aquiluna sp.]
MDIQELLAASKAATVSMAGASTTQKNLTLEGIARELEANVSEIIAANELDLAAGEQSGLSKALQDRLRLDAQRVKSLASAVREIISLPDPVGDSVQGRTLANGLMIQQVRVPFGVIGCIYEARPNVTVDIAALAIKSGNCAVLRGGSAAENTNKVLISVIQKGLIGADLPSSAVATVDPFGRNGAVELMQARGLVDVLIPRGSANLIHTVVTESKVPVIETGDGIVHIFADASANVELAIPIIVNSKAQRPSVCNSLETLLVHEQVAADLLPKLAKALAESSVLVHACEQSIALMPSSVPATEQDWATEYLGLELSVRVVKSLDQAIAHISKYSTK